MVTARGILIEAFSVLQNIAMSFTLDVDPIDPRVVPQAGALAREVGIDAALFDLPAGRPGREMQMRVHLARALALGPKLLIAEHASASLPRAISRRRSAPTCAGWRSRAASALVAVTADDALARAIGGQRLELVGCYGRASCRPDY